MGVIKISLFKLIFYVAIFTTLVFFSGYFVRSIHYGDDTQRLGKAQKDLGVRIDGLYDKEEIDKLSDSMERFLQDQQSIAELNQEHAVLAFATPEPKEDD